MAQDIVGSKMPANNGYAQNGYTGPSSDTDLKNPTRSTMARELFPSVDLTEARDPRGLRMAGKGRGAKKQPTLPALSLIHICKSSRMARWRGNTRS